jgi:fructokinase
MDFIPVETVGGARAYRPCPGGSSYNVARALGRLGVPTGLLAAVSRDFFGEDLIAGLRESGVRTDFLQRLDLPSTLGFVSLDRVEPVYAFFDTGAAERSWQPAPGDTLPAEVTALHVGSIALVREPAGAAFAALALAEAGGTRIVSLDPNIRPELVRDEACYRARLARLLAVADIIKISAHDLDWLMPGVSPDDAASSWFQGRAALVVITRGAEGVTGWTRRARIAAPSIPTEMVDTVGAGDSFMAGLLARLHEAGDLTPADLPRLSDSGLRNALALGQTVASLTCARQGADAPWRKDLGRKDLGRHEA